MKALKISGIALFALLAEWISLRIVVETPTKNSARRINSFEGREEVEREGEAIDNDWFMLQRVFPYDDVDPAMYESAREKIRTAALMKSGSTAGEWKSAGPSNVGGRITSLALHPTNARIIYAGAATGGVWKSTDGGGTWVNVFNGSPSIGSLMLSPANPEIIYVGTGEGNPGGVAIYPGNGIWRSTNGGQTWTNLGLTNTGQIGKLAIHPDSPNRIFAAALGRYRSRTPDRGIYRSVDSGATWQRVLYLNDTTGACEVLIDPSNQNRIYAAMWNRYRPLTYSIIGGVKSGLWISTDGGDNWTQATNGFPSNASNVGRISLAIAPSQPSMVYALVSNGLGVRGIYRSTDSGISWAQVLAGNPFGNEGQVWYNNYIAVHPTNPAVLFAGMTWMYKSTDSGATWSDVSSNMHVDHHAILFDSNAPASMAVGNDGGVFFSTNTGSSWIKSYHLPITQFYAGTVDFSNPVRYLGGTQDNGTPRTLTGSDSDWTSIYGGDGFYVLVDPKNPNRVYAEYQYGGLGFSTDGGFSFANGTNGINSSDRKNWCTPIAMNQNRTLTLYTGTHRLYRTVNGTLPLRWVSRVTIDPDSANVAYVTQSGYLEDVFSSHLNKTTNFGQTWSSFGGDLPDIPLNDIIVDPVYRGYFYVATDVGVMVSSNGGKNWITLGTGLPEVPVHDLTLHSSTRKLVAFTHGRSAYTFDLTALTSAGSAASMPVKGFGLEQNFPNPFNPTTVISYQIPVTSMVTLEVFDALGREVATLANGEQSAGPKQVQWNAKDVSSGIYFYRLQSGAFTETKKMIVAK